jgi:translocation and assembly module TamB
LGSVNIVEGSYARFGQSLKIERGVLRFAGPIDNPSLDIEAVRPNLAVNVSVRVAGTAQSPKVRLESATAMSEAEKLSWLALGAPLGDTLSSEQSGTFASALAGLLADATGAESGITQTLGLSQLGMAKNDKGTNIVTVGKRLGDRLLVTYEQGLRGVWNILRVQLQLTKQLEVRVQAGTESSIDLLWVIPLQQ